MIVIKKNLREGMMLDYKCMACEYEFTHAINRVPFMPCPKCKSIAIADDVSTDVVYKICKMSLQGKTTKDMVDEIIYEIPKPPKNKISYNIIINKDNICSYTVRSNHELIFRMKSGETHTYNMSDAKRLKFLIDKIHNDNLKWIILP